MKQFFKIVFASMIGAILSTVVMFLICLVILVGIISSAGKESKVKIAPNTLLHLTFDYPIKERTSSNPLEGFDFMSFDNDIQLGLNDILKNIHKAKNDPNISGIYLDVSIIPSGFSTIEEIRNALIDFKRSGKFIIAYSEVYTQGAYYLASVADKIYLNPAGIVTLKGFNAQLTFLKGTLDKLGVEPQIIRVGTFKSAVEPLMLDKMSDANREQTSAFVGSMYQHFIYKIAESRKIPSDSLMNIVNKLLVRNPQDALKYKIIDDIFYKDELLTELAKRTSSKTIQDIKFTELKKYRFVSDPDFSTSKNKIAVIYASGDIQGGEGDDNVIGSDRLSTAIRKARMDKDIKAIVLRINSPGGSALASDVIWREVVLAKKEKPVIACMGDVAASGGYYIACAADSIIAQPNTITGSIGVFGVLLNAKEFFNNKLGVTFDNVKTGEFADMGTLTRPLTEAEKEIIQQEVNHIYEDFTSKVAAGRQMKLDRVKEIAEGRVWSGIDAQKIGLVDKLGGINEAIAAASKMAKLSDYRIVSLPKQKNPFEKLLEDFSTDVKTYITQQQLGELYSYYNQFQQVKNFQGIQARLPFNAEIY